MLLKRPDLFALNFIPSLSKKRMLCLGFEVKSTSMSNMNKTNVLGYGNEGVDEAVLKAVKDGNMST